ncbi:MAG: AraC family transcriptional regulator [Alteromonadaceae bacterium]|nr:MAG: AraC family transcriptional regulator [Alteromonadaceae bacterium]
MDTVLFNFHDLVLILTAFECLLLASLLGVSASENPKSTRFFIGFLLCHALIPLHELTFWGAQFRIWMLELSPNVFFLGSYSYFLDGPLLYFFIRALTYKDFKLQQRDSLHLVPLGLYLIQMVFFFYSLDYERRHELIETQHIAYSAPYLYFDFIGKYIRLFYALICFLSIHRYSQRLKDVSANLNAQDLIWLRIMVLSLLLLFTWDAALLSVKFYGLMQDHFDLDLLNILGVSAYHINFVVLNVLIFLKFTRLTQVETVDEDSGNIDDSQDKANPAAGDPKIKKKYIDRIDLGMKSSEVYAMPNITLDKLATALDVPAKKLSYILKSHYKANFYEFVNGHRIEKVKALLRSPEYSEKTITEIYYQVGFNSKSVFNTFFRRMVGMTPTQYRESEEPQAVEKTNMF